MTIPDIPDFKSDKYKDLIDNLNKGACIFFGAGISKLAGYKLWLDLARELCERFWDRRKELPLDERIKFDHTFKEKLKAGKAGDEIDIFEYLHNANKKIYFEEIKEIFYRDQRNADDAIYQYLKKFNVNNNIFITTNIDMSFQKCLRIRDELVSICPNFSLNEPKKLNYLHGRLDNENSWVFTLKNFNSNYDSEAGPSMKFLKKIVNSYCVLFIGYGIREHEIRKCLSNPKSKNLHYWLESHSRLNQDALQLKASNLKENCNIELIPYSIERDGYDSLYDVLMKLHEAMNS